MHPRTLYSSSTGKERNFTPLNNPALSTDECACSVQHIRNDKATIVNLSSANFCNRVIYLKHTLWVSRLSRFLRFWDFPSLVFVPFSPLRSTTQLVWLRWLFPVILKLILSTISKYVARVLPIEWGDGETLIYDVIERTWITPPPVPPQPDKNTAGKSNIFPNQSIITTSSSVHAGLAICKRTSKR